MGSNKNWTPEEIEYLTESWGNTSIDSICKHLNRSYYAIDNKVRKLQLGKFLNNSDRYINKNQLFKTIGCQGSCGYRNISFIQNRGLPTHKIRRKKAVFEVVDIQEFWIWAEKNKAFLDFSKFEPYTLGPEPEWVDVKRNADKLRRSQYNFEPWTSSDDSMLKELLKFNKYTCRELSKRLRRTEGAIIRRISELKLDGRPIKEDNHILWTDEQYETLCEMIKYGFKYEEMSDIIDKSTKAIRGRVYAVYLTESLDKVREIIGDGKWGDNRPERLLRHKNVMSLEEKMSMKVNLSNFLYIIREYAKRNSTVDAEYSNYWQKDMCMNWDDLSGCTAGEKDCDTCTSFIRIQPQYCKRCGRDFFEREENLFCKKCRDERRKSAQRKWAVLNNKSKRG